MGGAPGYVPPGMGHYGQRQGHQQQMKHGKRKGFIKVLYIKFINVYVHVQLYIMISKIFPPKNMTTGNY